MLLCALTCTSSKLACSPTLPYTLRRRASPNTALLIRVNASSPQTIRCIFLTLWLDSPQRLGLQLLNFHWVPMNRASPTWQHSACVCVRALPLSAEASLYSLFELSAGSRGSMFIMRCLWLSEVKLLLWPNWHLQHNNQSNRKHQWSKIRGKQSEMFIHSVTQILNLCLRRPEQRS